VLMGLNNGNDKSKFFRIFTIPRLAIGLVVSLTLCLGGWFIWPDDSEYYILFFMVTMIGLIGTVFSSTFLVISIIGVFANIQLEARLEQEAKEEERLAKIRASMTPAEWEAYKLQLENNKLLKDIKRRGNSNKTTTTFGFIE